MGVGYGIVEVFEEGVIFFRAIVGGEAEGFDAFDEDLFGVGLGLDEVDGLSDEILEGHGAWVGGLGAAHELGLNVRRDDLYNLDVGGAELVTEGLGPGMDGGFGGAVGRGDGHGNKGEAGGFGEDGGAGLLEKLWEQRSGEAHGAEEVGSDDGLGVG